jgi:hypothetical protein
MAKDLSRICQLQFIENEHPERTSVNTKYLVINDHAQGQKVEHVGKIMPNIRIPIFPRAFGIEPIRLRNTPRLMVSPNQMHSMRVSKLQTN